MTGWPPELTGHHQNIDEMEHTNMHKQMGPEASTPSSTETVGGNVDKKLE
jgi:hypothetical protein